MGRLWKVILAVVALVALVVAGAGPVAAQYEDDGLDIVSDTTYAPQPERAVIEVHSTYTITNEKPTEYGSRYITSYYFDSFPIWLPIEARGVQATVGGEPVGVEVTPLEDDTDAQVAIVSFPSSIWLGQSVTVDVTYLLLGGGARDDEALTRVNPSYLAFPVWVCCDPEQTSVHIEMPAAFAVDLGGDLDILDERTEGDVVIYEAADIADPYEFSVFLFGRNDDDLAREEISVADAIVTVSAWPDDPEWRDHTAAAVGEGIPELEAMTGLSWPDDLDLEIIETVTPYLYGYGGWYDDGLELIEIGEELDDQLIYHELSHVWFNDSLFRERWITEGLAELYSHAARDRLGGEPVGPTSPSRPLVRSAAGQPLNEWDDVFLTVGDQNDAAEEYGYNTSWYVMDRLADEIGLDGVAAILTAIDGGELSYQVDGAEGAPEIGGLSRSWRRFLDLAEFRGGSTMVQELLREFVLTDDQVADMDARNAALEIYTPFVERSGAWPAPRWLRQQMDRWAFLGVGDWIAEADLLLEARNRVNDEAAALDLAVPTDIAEAYLEVGDASEFADLVSRTESQLAAMATVRSAQAAAGAEFDFWTSWGLRGEDLDAELAEVRQAFEENRLDDVEQEAAQIDALVAQAPEDAKDFWTKVALGVGAGLLVLVALVVWWLVRRRRRRGLLHLEAQGGAPAGPEGVDGPTHPDAVTVADVDAPGLSPAPATVGDHGGPELGAVD